MSDTTSPATASADRTALSRRWREDAPIYIASSVLLAACLASLAAKGIHLGPEIIPLNAKFYLLSAGVLFVAGTFWQLWRHRPARPLAFIGTHYFAAGELRSRLLGGLPVLLILMAFMPFFSTMKSAIPLFQPYDWDQTFIAWDRALFFGHDPWEVLQPVLGYPAVTSFMSVLYHAWILVCYPGTVFLALVPADAMVRRRFMMSFVLGWSLLGGVMAILLASYGPCFVNAMLGIGTFDAQMDYLKAADAQYDIMTLKVQDLLLAQFHQDVRGLGSGISAMPSMHVAMALLFWLGIREVSRPAGWCFFAFFVAIWIGSVHLAYHYAVDGLISVIAMALIWHLAGKLFTWWDAWQPGRNGARMQDDAVPAQ